MIYDKTEKRKCRYEEFMVTCLIWVGQGVCSAYDIILAHGGVIGRTLILVVIGHSTRAVATWRSIPGTVLFYVCMRVAVDWC